MGLVPQEGSLRGSCLEEEQLFIIIVNKAAVSQTKFYVLGGNRTEDYLYQVERYRELEEGIFFGR